MRFWDSSAIVPLLVTEERTDALQAVLAQDSAMLVWWGSSIECLSALARRERESADLASVKLSLDRLRNMEMTWQEVEPSEAVRQTAARFIRVHPLRAADSFQLAAAFVGSEQRPSALTIVTLDQRLAEAAQKEGFAAIDFAALDRP